REPDAAGDHPAFGRRIDGFERTAERPERRQARARLDTRQDRRADARALVEDGHAERRAFGVAEDFENRERGAQQRRRAGAGRRPDHDELSGTRARGDLGCGEREYVVVGRQPPVLDHRGVDVHRHPPKYTLRSMRFLRLLTNSLLAGALGAAYLTILVLHLNPQIPLASSSLWRWYLTLGSLYGIHLAL